MVPCKDSSVLSAFLSAATGEPDEDAMVAPLLVSFMVDEVLAPPLVIPLALAIPSAFTLVFTSYFAGGIEPCSLAFARKSSWRRR